MIVEKLNESYSQEYSDLLDANKSLDQRATIILTVSGVFLAGIFSFTVNSTKCNFNSISKWLLIVSLVLLLFEIILIIWATLISKYAKPPLGTVQNDFLRDIKDEIDDSSENERYKRFLNDCSLAWDRANRNINKKIEQKAKILLSAQILLAIVVFLSILSTIFFLW